MARIARTSIPIVGVLVSSEIVDLIVTHNLMGGNGITRILVYLIGGRVDMEDIGHCQTMGVCNRSFQLSSLPLSDDGSLQQKLSSCFRNLKNVLRHAAGSPLISITSVRAEQAKP